MIVSGKTIAIRNNELHSQLLADIFNLISILLKTEKILPNLWWLIVMITIFSSIEDYDDQLNWFFDLVRVSYLLSIGSLMYSFLIGSVNFLNLFEFAQHIKYYLLCLLYSIAQHVRSTILTNLARKISNIIISNSHIQQRLVIRCHYLYLLWATILCLLMISSNIVQNSPCSKLYIDSTPKHKG